MKRLGRFIFQESDKCEQRRDYQIIAHAANLQGEY